MPEPNTVICTYRPKPEHESAFQGILIKHWPALLRLGFAWSGQQPLHYRGLDPGERPFYVEIFTWASNDALVEARQHPEIRAIWDAMAPLCEERDGRPPMEFPHVIQIDYSAAWADDEE